MCPRSPTKTCSVYKMGFGIKRVCAHAIPGSIHTRHTHYKHTAMWVGFNLYHTYEKVPVVQCLRTSIYGENVVLSLSESTPRRLKSANVEITHYKPRVAMVATNLGCYYHAPRHFVWPSNVQTSHHSQRVKLLLFVTRDIAPNKSYQMNGWCLYTFEFFASF